MSNPHWHVGWGWRDEDDTVTDSLVDVFDYAATELDRAAAQAYEVITTCGDVGEYEQAYRHFQQSERIATLALNAQNLYAQGTLPPALRAPLYRDEDPGGARWQVAAQHLLESIEAEGPNGFAIRRCVLSDCLKKEG